MEAKDLMIGDWVICNHYLDKPFYHRFGLVDFIKGDYDFCEPIPLTPEILEKNGFCQYGDIFKIDGDGFEIQIRLGMYVRVFNGMDNTCNFKTDFYIHNLQHALRMCKINKEILL